MNAREIRAYAMKLRDDVSISNQRLELTREHAEIWFLISKDPTMTASYKKLESLILAVARSEWGPEAEVEFDYFNQAVHVREGNRARTIEPTLVKTLEGI